MSDSWSDTDSVQKPVSIHNTATVVYRTDPRSERTGRKMYVIEELLIKSVACNAQPFCNAKMVTIVDTFFIDFHLCAFTTQVSND